ncbi:MAG: glycoside hydrolase family 13 protein [Bifidobacteriaceae bacterium]|nr:glycoside hydrolase family 13 protein [Bifidobacteriaceae bacterium]
MTENNAHDDWWKQAVVYQVYPRSFKDSDGDGLGDINGITSKIGYLKDLGVDALWLSPFYPSELADGGYDVIDYRNVDERLGTMRDFDELTHEAHANGLKMIVDIVPNHTSTQHVWFKEAVDAGRGSRARERYIFREGRGKHGEIPPNDWVSFFGGPAWEQVEDGQWYLHIFAKQQADLNWQNKDVHEDFKKTLRFWSDHGADGFRIDVAHGLAKDLTSRPLAEMGEWDMHDQLNPDGTNPLWDRDEVHSIYREWREVFNEYTPARFAVGEAWVVPEHQYRYASPDELGQVFNFEFAKANWSREEMKAAIAEGLASADRSGSTTTWVMSNHDVPRVATRYALPQVKSTSHHQFAKDWILRDGESYHENHELGTRRARAALLLEAGLPGSVYIYQGEELGLFEVPNIPWNRLEDPNAFHTRGKWTDKGRDGCRVPLPWVAADAPHPADWDENFGDGASFGFSPATTAYGKPASAPHLPQPLWFKDFAEDSEHADPTSMLNLYRTALSLRAHLLTPTGSTQVQWSTVAGHEASTLSYSREIAEFGAAAGVATAAAATSTIAPQQEQERSDANKRRRFVSITNFGSTPIELPEGKVLLSSTELVDGQLPGDASVWLSAPESYDNGTKASTSASTNNNTNLDAADK